MTNLKRRREAKGLTQRQLAEAAGINLRMVQHYEQGRKQLIKANVLTVFKLAAALDCEMGDIVEEVIR